jgi:hypothetical protein
MAKIKAFAGIRPNETMAKEIKKHKIYLMK